MTLLLTGDDAATFEVRMLLAAEAAHSGAALSPQQLECLLDRLAAAAHESFDRSTENTSPETVIDEPGRTDTEQHMPNGAKGVGAHEGVRRRRTHREGPGWACAHKLTRLRLPRELRDRRRSLLDGLALSNEQRIVSGAQCALSDAAADDRPLEDAEAVAVRSLLDLPLLKKADRPRRESRRRAYFPSQHPLLTGHAEAAAAAAKHLEVLGDDFAQRIHDIAERSNTHTYAEAVQALAAHGGRFEMAGMKKAIGGIVELAAAWNLEQELPLLRATAELADDNVEMTAARSWRLLDLCDLFTVLEADAIGTGSFVAATTIDTDNMRRGWIRAAAVAAGLDVATVAAQARLALDERGDDDEHTILHLLTAPAPDPRPTTDANRLGADEQEALVTALGAGSSWIAHSAFEILWGSHGEQLRERLLKEMLVLPAHRRYLAALLACCAVDDPVEAAAQLLEQTDPAARAGAIHYLSLLPEPNEQAQILLTQARVADDLTIRLAARQGQQPVTIDPPVTHWSCQRCAKYNDPTEVDCRHCDSGTRPSHD